MILYLPLSLTCTQNNNQEDSEEKMMIYLPNLRNKCSGPSSVVSPLLAELKNMFLDSDPPATTSILAHICLIL